MKTMVISTLMMLIATPVQAAQNFDSKKEAFKDLASTVQKIAAQLPVEVRVVVDRNDPGYKALNAIGVVSAAGNNFYGTGFLVTRCHVLTNSHVIFENPIHAKVNTSVLFSVGQGASQEKPFLNLGIDGIVIAHGLYGSTDETRNSDWALIKLSKSIGNSVGHIPYLQAKDPKKLIHRKVLTAGFPGDRTNGVKDLSKIYADLHCKIIGTSILGYALHNCQTSGGQSGSPILTKDDKGNYYAIGMVSGGNGYGLTKSENPNEANMAVNFLSTTDWGRDSEGDKIATAIRSGTCE